MPTACASLLFVLSCYLLCVQLNTLHVKVWRVAALLLRAIWDAVPEMRGLYVEYAHHINDAIKDDRRWVLLGV